MPSSSDPTPPVNVPPCAVPPILDPELYERHEGLSETTLAFFTTPEHNQALRAVGELLYSMALECTRFWPVRSPRGFSSSKAAPWWPISATCKATSPRWMKSGRHRP